MRKGLFGAALVGAALYFGASASAIEIGDMAPEFDGKEFINTDAVSMKKLRGRVIFYEVFRTW